MATVAAIGALLAACGRSEPEPTTTPTVDPAAEATGVAPVADGSAAAQPPSVATPPPAAVPVVSSQAASDRDLAIRLGLVQPEPLQVARLLTHGDVREIVRYDGALALGVLEGIEPSTSYNTIRLASESGYGFAVQLWRESSSRLIDERYNRLRQTYFVATDDTEPVGDLAFRAEFEGIRHYALLDRATRSVVVVTCQSDLCTDLHSRALAERVRSRL